MNRIHKACWLVLAAFLTLATPAAGQERVAVLDFKNLSDLDAVDVDYLTDHVVRGEVRRTLPRSLYSVVTKENLESLLADQGIRLEDVCEGSCEIDVGRKIQAHLVVTGKVLRMGRDITVTLKMYNTKAGEFLGSEEARGADVSGTAANLKLAVARLMKSAVAPAAATPVFVAPGAVPSGPSEAGVTELEPTARPAAAAGPAGLYITTEPPGAEVYLGEIRAGTTSPAFQKTDLEPGGEVRVTLRKPDYHDKVFDVELKPGIAKYEGVKLAPAFGTLVLETSPAGARVTIGGADAGTTPYRNERMASGRHLASLELDLYRPVRNEVVEVKDGEVTRKTYALEADFGTLAVDSAPRGARVLVAGKEKGKTPAELKLPPGEYEVGLELEGHRARSYRVTVARGSKVEIRAPQGTLAKKEFSLTVLADPPLPGARVWLDGKDTGKSAPETFAAVAEGTRTVEVKLEGKLGKAEVTGRDGEAKTVTVELKGAPAAPTRPAGQAVVEGAGSTEGMVLIPGGTFWMGCVSVDDECEDDEMPRHQVTVSSFWMDTHEVTQARYESVTGKNPSLFEGCGDCPVEQVSWNDARDFCSKVGKRLPTEAEWEYVARGGKDGEVCHGSLDAVAWYNGNSGYKTHLVGQQQPNGYGLYDMLGNVWEWCADWYEGGYYGKSPSRDPAGPGSGQYRVLRGGGWLSIPMGVRASCRGWGSPGLRIYAYGFRCVRDQ